MITILGGSGFVGSLLIKSLGKENCLNLDKNSSPFYQSITTLCDIRNYKSIDIDPKSSFVILLAAEHRDDVSPASLYYDVNVQGTKNVLKKMDELEIKNLIFTSSVAVYGLNKKEPDENHVKEPFNHYGKSKWQAELEVYNWYKRNPEGKSVTIIRPTVLFGERNRGNVYNLLKQISSGKFLVIGNGQNKKSMAYVGNLVAFIQDRIGKQESGLQTFNYADKPDFTMTELASFIERKMNLSIPKTRIPYWLGMLAGYAFDILAILTKRKLSISSVRVKKFCATTQFNAAKAHLSFTAPYSLEEGLNRTLQFEFIDSKKDNIQFYSD